MKDREWKTEKTKAERGAWWLLHPDNYIKKFKRPMPLSTDPSVLSKIKRTRIK